MFVGPADDPRSSAACVGERGTLTGYLHAYRQTLGLKCQGLDAQQMARRSVYPSDLSLLGLVRHMADVERNWFRVVLAGEEAPQHFGDDGDWDAAFRDAAPDAAGVEEAWSAWRGEVDFAERFVDGGPDFDRTGVMRDGQPIALREMLVHKIEEYARHGGHADLIRERIDGRIG
ncbi:MAG: DinB family protein [Streptosporangiaceae bacterium]